MLLSQLGSTVRGTQIPSTNQVMTHELPRLLTVGPR